MFDSVLDYLAVAAFLPFLVFALIYSTLKWWENPAGWSIWLLAVTCVLALSSSVWRQLVETAPPAWFRFGAFALVIAAGWFQLIAFLVVIVRARRRGRDVPPADPIATRVDSGQQSR